jgi:hypothetical protein
MYQIVRQPTMYLSEIDGTPDCYGFTASIAAETK